MKSLLHPGIALRQCGGLRDVQESFRKYLGIRDLPTQLHIFANSTYLSDNGCAGYVVERCSNGLLRGNKRYYWDGGIRIPFIAKWPAGLPRGGKYSQPVISLDLFATVAAAVGSDATAQGSVNLLPHLRREAGSAPHEYLFWRAKPNVAVRKGNWKLWKVNKSDLDESATAADEGVAARLAAWAVDPPLRLIQRHRRDDKRRERPLGGGGRP